MAQKEPKERFLDFGVRGKFGKAWQYGEAIYSKAHYANKEEEWDRNEYGIPQLGWRIYGTDDKRWGIWQLKHRLGKRIFTRGKFYIPSNPQTAPQQAWRAVFANGMTAWGALTSEQQKEYNDKANKLGLLGKNLFMKNYLNSH